MLHQLRRALGIAKEIVKWILAISLSIALCMLPGLPMFAAGACSFAGWLAFSVVTTTGGFVLAWFQTTREMAAEAAANAFNPVVDVIEAPEPEDAVDADIFNPVVDVVQVPEPSDAHIRKIHEDNNKLLENLPEEKTELLSDQEIASCKEIIATMDGQKKKDAEQQLADYEAYVAEPCSLDEKSKRDADFNALTIEANYSEEGQPAGRTWATTYHFQDFQKYIQSCNNENKPATALGTRDPLNDAAHITIYKGFLHTIVSFIKNVREAISRVQNANVPVSKKEEARTARLDFYGRLFSSNKANDSKIPAAPAASLPECKM